MQQDAIQGLVVAELTVKPEARADFDHFTTENLVASVKLV